MVDLNELFADFDPDEHDIVARSTQGTIVRVRRASLDLAVKIPSGRGPTRWLHTLALRREHRAYRQLEGIPGFPRCHGLFSGRYLALEYLEGQPLKHNQPPDPDDFYERLLRSIELMHARGVAHGDLRTRRNVMITTSGKPVIIDLGTAIVRKTGWHPINQRIFRFLCKIDRNSWVKLKYGRYTDIDEADRHLLDRSLLERLTSRLNG